MSLVKNTQQRPQENKKVGAKQSERVPTHEGSQLGSPSKAGVSTGRTPHLSK